jgi:hypothetical protein
MNSSITFTHLVTDKKVVVVDRTSISAVFIGDCTLGQQVFQGATWIVLENVASPIPVKETQETILKELGLAN